MIVAAQKVRFRCVAKVISGGGKSLSSHALGSQISIEHYP